MQRRHAALACASTLLAACGSGPRIDTSHVAQGQDSRVLFLILHFTVAGFSGALRVLTQGPVSSHYLISDEDPPVVYRLVDESRRAWHAGDSWWKGHAMLNASSIGIEIVNPGPLRLPDGSRRYAPYRPAQIDALLPLVRDIVARHGIRGERILGHSDIRPRDKDDPGPAFPWRRLADEGLIPWPDPLAVRTARERFEQLPPDIRWFQAQLAQVGYRIDVTGQADAATRDVLSVFQMKYRPSNFDGGADAETAALLQVLIDMPTPR